LFHAWYSVKSKLRTPFLVNNNVYLLRFRYFYVHRHIYIYIYIYIYIVKVKQSRNRPGVAQRVPGGLGSQIFRTFGT
jgi:hypothetical protein